MRTGLTLGLEGTPLRDAVDLCASAESLGYTDAWSAEVGGADGFTPLAAVAERTSEMRLGTAIVPAFTRPPALVAMSASTLQAQSGGRFVLGLGTSSHIIVERWMGERFDKPLTRMREYVEVLREAFSGRKVDYEGRTITVRGFRLQLDPGSPPPIFLAALGPAACRLAGEIADGVIFFLKTPDGVRASMELVAEGARAAGRDPASIESVIRVPVAMDEDDEVFRFMSRRLITTYAMVDVYNRSLSGQGYATEMSSIATAWSEGRRDEATSFVTDEMIDELQISGDADACRKGVQRFRDAGITVPVLFPVSVAGDPGERAQRVMAAVRALAPSA